MPKRSDDPKSYDRKPISNYEGFKRLDKSLEKIDVADRAKAKICEVCLRRCRAWRIVPATFGTRLGETKASLTGGLTGKFVVACDAGPDGCAAMLTRSGVAAEAIREHELASRLRLELP